MSCIDLVFVLSDDFSIRPFCQTLQFGKGATVPMWPHKLWEQVKYCCSCSWQWKMMCLLGVLVF